MGVKWDPFGWQDEDKFDYYEAVSGPFSASSMLRRWSSKPTTRHPWGSGMLGEERI